MPCRELDAIYVRGKTRWDYGCGPNGNNLPILGNFQTDAKYLLKPVSWGIDGQRKRPTGVDLKPQCPKF